MRRVVLLCLLLAACGKAAEKKEPEKAAPEASLKDKDKGQPKRKLTQVKPTFDLAAPPATAETLPDGLVFAGITEGSGAAPLRNDGVKLKYSAWRMDGTTFATTEPTGQPTTMWLYAVAPGFSEALMKMKIGGKAMFWVPPEIGYPRGRPKGTPEKLAYEVELLEIVSAPPTPPDLGVKAPEGTKTDGGVAWKLVAHGKADADRPRAWDKVAVKYTGWDETGRIVDTNEMYGKPMILPVDRMPPVFAVAVPSMAVGDRARMWFPAEMMGKGPNQPTGTITFEVELVSVTHLNEPPKTPKDVAAPPANAKKTPKGAFYVELKPGDGPKPTMTDRISVQVTGWTTDGKRFMSSIPDGKPASYRVNGVVPGWTDALLLMPQGATWRIWVPKELAYNDAPGRPAGMLVFDVELLSIEAQPPHQPKKPAVP